MIVLETKRIQLVEVEKQDASFLFELMNTPTWLEFIGDRNIKSIQDAERHIENAMRKSYLDFGFGFYKIVVKETGQSVGTCGLIKRPNLDHVDIGYALLPRFEGNGYAIESASALMTYGTDQLGLYPILGVTTQENVSSQKILEKIGLRFVGTIPWGDEPEAAWLYSNEKDS